MKNLKLLCLLGLTILSVSACTGSPEQIAASGEVLFQDEFSDPASGWNRVLDTEGNITDYENGGYRILNNKPISHIWSNPGLKFSDVQVEVDVTKLGGPEDNFYGVICRYKDGSNFYILAISSDGYYGMIKVKDGTLDLLGANDMQPNEMIIQGNATNHLRADCVTDTLALYANGQLLTSVQDSDFKTGDVGLEVSTRLQAGVDILFDNLSVIKP